MNLPLFIARRYLFAKKSHNVINIISAISAIGMAIGTAALIIILSVYNGFDSLIKDNLSDIAPDILVTPSHDKKYIPEENVFDSLWDIDGVEDICSYIKESVFVNYDGMQGIAVAKGIEDDDNTLNRFAGHVRSGEFRLRHGEIPMCAVGYGLAYNMGISPNFVAPLEIYYPDREKNISIANPTSSLRHVKVRPSSLISVNAEEDNSLVILPIEEMRTLLKYDREVSATEIWLKAGCSKKEIRSIINEIRETLGPDFKVSDRYMQNESLYKMMKYEKAAIFLILIFIIIIIAFNIFGSLSMLIIEKRGDIETLTSMGGRPEFIRKIFILEGWMISLYGLVTGLAFGVGFSLIQQHFGIIKMPGNYMVDSYPVIISISDIGLTAVGVATIGYVIALLPVASYCKINDY